MSRGLKIVAVCAVLGFSIPLALMAYYSLANSADTGKLFLLCPASVVSIALDNMSISTALTVWLFICLSNALLYAAPAAIVVLFTRLFRPASRPPSILK